MCPIHTESVKYHWQHSVFKSARNMLSKDWTHCTLGPCKVQNETETKRNEIDRHETKQIETNVYSLQFEVYNRQFEVYNQLIEVYNR